MNLVPSFVAASFAVAGLIAAAGPVIIHLLNRRRYRIVHWAAMDFLREALQRNRKILTLRDLLLLALRTLAVLLVGLALARPFFSTSEQAFDSSKPLHAVLVIDNSLSMGYESLEGTLLDRARERARQFIDRLPADSRVTVIPLCGSRWGYSPDAATKESALQTLGKIELVDRSASILRAVNEAQKACEAGPALGHRIVVFSDQQISNWRDLTRPDQFQDVPPIQVVDISAADPQNAWISAFRVQDGVADVETPTTFLVEIRYDGPAPRPDVEVQLIVDDQPVAAKTVTLEPGQGAREVSFEHLLNAYQPEPGKSLSVPVKVSLTPDNLPADDERCLVVPVVAALPVVCVDQYGAEEEDPVKNRLGETRLLRKLLAPVASRAASARQLVRVRHVKLDQVTQELLEDARLVVVAGIADPGEKTSLLREYVEQGGQLVIAAGGAYDPGRNSGFDPVRWTEAAWLDGMGILPAPLLPEPLGALPEEAAGEWKPFFLAFDSLQAHPFFQLAGVSEQELRDLYSDPFFFKAVRADVSDETLQALRQAERKRLEDEQAFLAQASARRKQAVQSGGESALNEAEKQQLRGDERRAGTLRPAWLLWSQQMAAGDEEPLPEDPAQHERRLQELAERTLPRVLARFDDPAGTPFLLIRQIGRGDVLLATSGLLSSWNTLPTTNAVVIFDRALRAMIQATLPPRNFGPAERIALPLPTNDREIALTLRRPDGGQQPELLDTGFVGKAQLGFHIEQPLARGVYRVTAVRQNGNGGPVHLAARQAAWDLPLAVNGEADESELQPLGRDQFDARVGDAAVRWVGPDEEISLAGTQVSGQDSWWWLILAVLGLLLIELLLVARWVAKNTNASLPAPATK
ncbi:MAG: VWA domain-containing protein [Candidatus Anammoximicrobium sp.]|nr:VWA domain-containing protein [Candidatus Anammoximicrobium sp.]